ncbi:hypothetical protein H4217_006439 [Coemansia sp. RSA 1939]|nr:hypothetical protein H4217_006439 [Coemansia sp. RSA 1939]KAJ2607224.1 hypothetical protein EV177_005635 [Coemansia sp. RSA 1804]
MEEAIAGKRVSLEPPPLKYRPPSNTSKPAGAYTLEVIKQGSLVGTHEFKGSDSTYFTFGRLPTCDFPMDHASISRYHAVLQFVDDGGKAQLVDLGSSHGSYVNKRKMQPNVPAPLDIGDQIRFGMSSRVWVFGSSDRASGDLEDDDDREESAEYVQRRRKSSTGRSDSKNPVKFLRLFLEENEHSYEPNAIATSHSVSEGTDNSNESATRIYLVRISLPFSDDRGGVLEGVAKAANKRDAERLACLDALQKLDKHGYLPADSSGDRESLAPIHGKGSSSHIGEIDDEDDNDDSYYYDHTLQHKRQRTGKHALQEEAPETYASLSAKLAHVSADMAQTERSINELVLVPGAADPSHDPADDADELDAYMTTLARSEKEGDRKRLTERLDVLRKEKERLETLVRLVMPDDHVGIGQPPRAVHPQKSDANKRNNGSEKEPSVSPHPTSASAPMRQLKQEPEQDDLERKHAASNSVSETHPDTIVSKDENKEEEESWQAPDNQTGDGRTFLNEKFGY